MGAYSISHHWLCSDVKADAETNTNYSSYDVGVVPEMQCRRNNHQLQCLQMSPLPSCVVQEHTSSFKGAMLLPDREYSINLTDELDFMFPDTVPSTFNFQHPSKFFLAHPPAVAATTTTITTNLKFSAPEKVTRSNIKMEDHEATPNSTLQVGRYSMEEKKDKILRYLRKRNQRNFSKTIKYACRKTLADRRVRVRGRFARNTDELSEEDRQMRSIAKDNISDDDPFIFTNSYNMSSAQMKADLEDEWLQEAVANLELMYLPPSDQFHYTSSNIICP